MTIQNYLIIENNVVANNVMWDGNLQTWQPPLNSIQLITSETPAMLWYAILTDNVITGWELKEFMGKSDIGFTWDGKVCITNEPKPPIQKPTK